MEQDLLRLKDSLAKIYAKDSLAPRETKRIYKRVNQKIEYILKKNR